MVEQGVTHIVECGPGKVLAGMVKRIDSQVRILGISSPESITQVLGELQEN
jgi:[acyl-carrier-protein] S-malonyltransferase